MKYILIFAVLFATTQCFIVPRLGNPEGLTPKVYTLQLNDPPRERWGHIVNDFKPRLTKFMLFLAEWIPVPGKAARLVGE